MNRSILILFIFILVYLNLNGQMYPTVTYTSKDGLVNNRIKYIFQDSQGKMYFATYGGLSVYDGSRFFNYTTDNGLASELINNILELGPDSLLLVENTFKFQLLVNGKVKNLWIKNSFTPVVNELFKSQDGKLYALADEGLFLFQNNCFSKINLCTVEGKDYAKNLNHCIQYKNYLLISADAISPAFKIPPLVFVYDLKTGRSFANLTLPKTLYIAKTPDGEILASTINGIKSIDLLGLDKGELHLKKPSFQYDLGPHKAALYMYADKEQNFWMIAHVGILKITADHKRRLVIRNNNQFIKWNCIFQDKENTMWFGNEETGVTKLVYQNFQIGFKVRSDFNVSDISTHYSNNYSWFFDGYKQRLLFIQGKHSKYFSRTGNKKLYWITANDSIVYGVDPTAIYKFHFLPHSKFRYELLFQDPSNQFGYHSLSLDKYGDLIAVSHNITVVFRNGHIITKPLDELSDQSFVRNDSVWVITRTDSFYLFKVVPTKNEERLILLQKEHLDIPNVRSMTVDHNGLIWVGTREHGLFYFTPQGKFHSELHLTMKDGLSENFVMMLFVDHYNNIWACNQAGMDRINVSDKKISIESIGAASNLFIHILKLQEDHDGTLWALTNTDLCKIQNIFQFKKSGYIPHLQLVRASVNNIDFNSSFNKIELPASENNISFHLAMPSYINEKNIVFHYLLKNSEKPILSKTSTLGDIDLYNLSPAHYSLLVTASFRNGIYPVQKQIYNFTIKPPWYRIVWVDAIFIILILIVAFFLIRFYYRSQIVKQRLLLERKEVIEQERNRIANDLHDELGSGLTKIAILSEVTKSSLINTGSNLEQLDKISNTSRELVDSLQDIIWVLNPKYDELEKVLTYIHQYIAEFVEESGIQLRFNIPKIVPVLKLSEEQRRNLLLVVKETVNNSIKHSGCSLIEFYVQLKNENLEIIIRDNGKGFVKNTIRSGGNGLSSMKQRMNHINGQYSIVTSSIGTTTSLSLTLSGDEMI